MNSPLARYLRDFGAESMPAAVHFEAPPLVEVESHFPAIEPFVEQVDLEAERRQAHDEGFKAASEQMTAEHAEALAELQQKHEAELEMQRQEFEGGIADYLAKALPELFDRLTSDLADATVRLLAPILKEQFDRQAVEELAEQLKPELAKEVLEQIKVSGPEHLCDLLRDKLEEAGSTIEFHPTEGTDLRVEMGDTLLVTRLSAFAADLERVLA
ncbi:hypothetical protein EPK99_15255 [Neorhizobium lilium]|uniref:Flagellar assembly protein FliH n=1 Tax=Neorhizobium lilium TaxID=2503024 RepID=A0A3S3TXA2_9HYPH|nr:hypothetical protein [Neorhizobium lilium]RWX77017.1 hypothetical protein EPK99_15255 [Neorhizobium lilium]